MYLFSVFSKSIANCKEINKSLAADQNHKKRDEVQDAKEFNKMKKVN